MGDLSYHYKLHKKDLSDTTKIEEIKHSIANLKLSANSFVIVDLPPKKSSPYLVFFQTVRERTFKHTNYYVYEIRVDISTPHGIQKKMYRADHQRKKDVLQAFEKICIQQTEPDLSEMEDITEKIFGGKKKDRQYDLAENLISQYLHSSLPTQIQQYRYEEALNHLAMYNYYETNQSDLLRAEVYIQYEQYEKAKMIYESMTYHDSATYRLASLICEGKFGKPDFKLAYEYFKHTTLLLDDLYQDKAKIKIARMYRDGKYLKQNYDKYLHIIKNLETKFTRSDAKFDLCLPELYYELTLIEQKNGNLEKALHYCQYAKHIFYEFAYCGGAVALKDAARVAKLFYSLTDFDANNMELMDLIYLLEKPGTVIFSYRNTLYRVKAFVQNGRILVKFGDCYFNGATDFFLRTLLGDTPIRRCEKYIEFIEVIR